MRYQSFLQWLPLVFVIGELFIVYKWSVEIDITVQSFFVSNVAIFVISMFCVLIVVLDTIPTLF